MAGTAVTVDGVSKRFRLVHERNSTLKATVLNGFRRTVAEDFWALQDVSLSVEEGTTYGLVGHNGSGKSTLLKCIARIYRPDRGRITSQGRMSALLELGAGFHPELSGRENVYLNGSILGMSRREVDRRFSDIVEFAGLEQFIDTPVKNYSSGMYVRLGFSVAITVEPDVLLVDEILAVGDEAFQQRCLEKFADLRRGGRTIVLVSHGLDSVRNLCDRAAWLDHGSLAKEGEAHDVVTAYLESVRDDRRSSAGDVASAEEAEGGWHVEAVTLVDGTGRPVEVVESGAELAVRVEVVAARDEDVALAVGLYRTDGVHVAGPVHHFRTGGPGPRLVEYRIPAVPLAAGSYDVSTRLLDDHLARTHAVRRRAARLDVRSDGTADIGGVVALHGQWKVTGG